MNILLCTDNKYVQHCATTIVSVLRNNNFVEVYIFSNDISLENRQKLKSLIESYNSTVQFIEIENELIQDFPMSDEASDHISIATYLRLFVETKLPELVEKIIYLDSDIIVRQSLADLWNIDINNYSLAAVYQYNEWCTVNHTYERLGYPEDAGYFNAGVLLINLSYWRKNKVSERLFEYVKSNFEQIISHDQDTMNAVLFNETLPLPCKWNLLPFFLEEGLKRYTFPRDLDYQNQVLEQLRNPSVLHFVYKPKPWESGCSHPWKNEYFYYLQFTPWQGWKPKFNLIAVFRYQIIPKLLNVRRAIISNFKLQLFLLISAY